ncbi:MAG: N-acetyl-gamma-glutamyl-phosphate reductase [Gemmataceae bacterium]
MTKIAIIGGTGYTALELLKILIRHQHVEIVAVTSRVEERPRVSDVHPVLTGRIDLRCEPFDIDELVKKGVECLFGCLPHGVSMTTLPVCLERGLRVVDLSADYRLQDPNLYAQWYGASHEDLAHLAQAVYGLPELYGEEIEKAQIVANPGCYPQTGILGLAPLVAGKLINLRSIIIDSKSGVSGAGRTPKLTTLFSECNESVAAYNVGKHRHRPEIEQALTDVAKEPVQVIFTPHLIPMDRGIFSTIYAEPNRTISADQLLDLYREYYQTAPFVRIVDHLPATKHTAHTNFLDITLRVDQGRIVVLVAEDNLIRGASGVAVQNFNRMYGYEETTSLL